METEPRLKVSSDRLVKPGIEPATPGLQGKWFIHYTTGAPIIGLSKRFKILTVPLPLSKFNIGSRIIFVCFAISNFSKCIVDYMA